MESMFFLRFREFLEKTGIFLLDFLAFFSFLYFVKSSYKAPKGLYLYKYSTRRNPIQYEKI